ncbi:MAG: hypothetical protein AAF727_16835 [Pseudomonadota bacterium]
MDRLLYFVLRRFEVGSTTQEKPERRRQLIRHERKDAMLTFLSSISWFGWAVIGLGLFTLWQVPTILRRWQGPRDEQKIQPGQEPPISGSGWW